MAGINKVTIIGNLGRDPELRHTQGGTAVCRLSVATTRSWMNKQTNERSEETGRVLDASGNEIPSVIAFWFAWSAFHGNTTIYPEDNS